ncbi:MAG: hypothetical protein ACYC5O_00835 [Anaerolineae bacterium]
MVAYATLDNVREQDPTVTYSTTSTPTATQVGQLLTDVAAEIDTRLEAAGFTVPVTTPAALLATVTRLNAMGAAALAHMGMFPESVGAGQTSDLGSRLWRMYQDGLAALEKAGPPQSKGAWVAARSYATDNPTDPTIAPAFRRGMEF